MQLSPSSKPNLRSDESWIVHRGGRVYLRLLGGPKHFELMTATTGDDARALRVCNEQPRLIQAAKNAAETIGYAWTVSEDVKNRPFVKFFSFSMSHGDALQREEAGNYVEEVSRVFFSAYDSLSSPSTGNDDLKEIHDALSNGGGEDDVYLSDGIWLSRDGSLHDRGR